ncbi:hypothetical protein L211DRAFT_834004 [Terfezia boudieri ATCC MYA-4762]|uniref:Uncharacterized protein n=1 Tax=Terfezia boudieri ATCC MYA-4762 TaxID=1051890 RepID=A0A3N4M3R1_9PEZI|nr:hypothetical protein L211DRAFT_834004 [Terfezia boudieri ATCC MYA-4762]
MCGLFPPQKKKKSQKAKESSLSLFKFYRNITPPPMLSPFLLLLLPTLPLPPSHYWNRTRKPSLCNRRVAGGKRSRESGV